LGWTVVRHRGAADDQQEPGPQRGAFVSGLLTNLLNPKALLFFVSLVPQFLRPEAGATPVQFLALGIVDIVFGFLPWTLVIMVGSRLSTWLADRRRRTRWDLGTGGLLVGVGAMLTGSSIVEAVRAARG
ncbi:MAG: LysE family transporter, partial [Propionibacteriales bacterium]|nr:LysE family transporter [Propionibacteriales bacterium]